MRRLGLLVMVGVVLLATGCGDGEEAEVRCADVEERHSQLRPTDPEDPAGYQGAETLNLVSPEGHVRVWWALEGEHAPPLADSNASGVPDYVELAASIGDEVGALLESEGWRRPLVGTNLAGSTEPLDLFLLNFTAGDGNYRPEYCGSSGPTTVCSGHLRVENDFRPLYYPSREYALRVVISHEFFHAVQYAYASPMPAWWAEGSATWFQEHFWAEQDDFERLTRLYLESTERSLHDRQRGPYDGFAYGASLFVYFLEQQIGVDGVLEIHEAMGRGEDALGAVEEVLRERWEGLEEAFRHFAVWNAFTGSRALEGAGYPLANSFSEVAFVGIDGDRSVNWNSSVDALAVRYALIEGERDISLQAEALEGFEPATLLAVPERQFLESGEFVVVGQERAVNFEAADLPLVVVVVNETRSGEQAVRLQVRGARAENAEEEEEQEVVEIPAPGQPEESSRGCATTGGSGGTTGWLLLLVGLFGLSRVAGALRSGSA